MRLILWPLFYFIFSASCFAQCPVYGQMRVEKIYAEAEMATVPYVLLVGDSHAERMATTHAQLEYIMHGHPVLFVGIAGATWQTIHDCVDWTRFSMPVQIILMLSVNDAFSGACCNGGFVTAAYANMMVDVIKAAQSAAPTVLASDPPTEYGSGVPAQAVHSMSRMEHYISGGEYGGVVGVPFIDIYYRLRKNVCADPSLTSYVGAQPCYGEGKSTLDRVHYNNKGIAAVLDTISEGTW